MNADFIEHLYNSEKSDQKYLGKEYNPPKKFEHGKRTLIIELSGDGDGVPVKVYETRLPARFFEIEFEGITLSTGSGMEKLIGQMAKAIHDGMLGVKK